MKPLGALFVVIYYVVGLVSRILHPTSVEGLENLPESGALLCPNHSSNWDPILVVLRMPINARVHIMAKQELFRNPIVAWFFRRMNAFPVVRGPQSREAIEHAVSLIRDGGILGIFPEGKRCREGRPTKAKSGIAMILSQVDAPVIPAAVYYKDNRRIFARANVGFGAPIPHELLEMKDNSREELRRVSATIMDCIIKEWEKING